MVIAKTVNFLRSILDQASYDCELILTKRDYSLTRFTQNAIHQGTQTEERHLHIRIVRDGKVGAFTTDRFDQDSIAHAVEMAARIADLQPEPEHAVVLPSARALADTVYWRERSARSTPYEKAQIIRAMVDAASPRNVELAGAVTSCEETTCIVNNRGVEAYQQHTVAELNLVGNLDGKTGYAFWVGNDIADMPFAALAEEAIAHAATTLEEVTIEPGPATVILDHYAVGTVLGFLGYIGFGAKNFLEGRSFLTQSLGKKICSSRVTLYDDGADPAGIPRLFDYEGVPKKKVTLIEDGVARSVVTDSATAPLVEVENTGHALPAPNSEGPLPMNLHMASGKTKLSRMIAATENGIYVRRFHYVNVVEPISTVLTGMTKDGTYLIRDGKLANPVTNLRFTESALGALCNVQQVSAETRLVEGVLGPVRCPALKIKDFHFTGTSSQ